MFPVPLSTTLFGSELPKISGEETMALLVFTSSRTPIVCVGEVWGSSAAIFEYVFDKPPVDTNPAPLLLRARSPLNDVKLQALQTNPPRLPNRAWFSENTSPSADCK